MALAAILYLEVKIVPKHNDYYSITTEVPKLDEMALHVLYYVLLVQEISLFLVFNMLLVTILKNGLLKYVRATEVQNGLFCLQIGFFCQISQECKFQKKMVTDPRKMTLPSLTVACPQSPVYYYYHVALFNSSQLAKMKKSIPDMSLP